MKKFHLIFGCTILFIILFYKESIGLNLAIFGMLLAILTFIRFPKRGFCINLLFIFSLSSCFAFAWYSDFISFLAMFFSLVFLQFQNETNKLIMIQSIPVILITGITSLGRPFIFRQWIPHTNIDNNDFKKLIAFIVIPFLFISLFFIAYSFGSDTFSGLLNYELDIELGPLIFIAFLGFYFSFCYWNYFVPQYFYLNSHKLNNDFSNESKNDDSPSFSFLEIDFERKSGEISLVFLNLMLLVFIATYIYEQFFKQNTTNELSVAIHDRVNAVIISIIMAVGVILFYFKKGFNFNSKANFLKTLAKIWIVLNAILILTSVVKNTEYILHFGLTYKRLGVYAFLAISLIGLGFTFYKIQNQKTNAYLFNQLLWCVYGLVLTCSFVNWGNLVTIYIINANKGVEPKFLINLNFNDESRRDFFKLQKLNGAYDETERELLISRYKGNDFLSKIGYYENLSER